MDSEGCRTALVEPSPRSQQILLLAQAPSSGSDAQHRCLKVSKSEDLAAAPDCDVLIFEATAGAIPWDLVSTLKAVATRVTPPRVWLVTESAQPVGPDDPVSPSQAAFWGIARTAALEYPQFWGGVIDVEPGVDGAQLAIEELKRSADEDQIAYRNGKRFVLRIVRQENIRASVPVFDPQGAYLISGGLGNLGMETAGWLVRHGARNLLLTGRTASRDQRGEQIAALESLGASITVVTADVAEAAGIDSIRALLGNRPLRGIVHTAAVFDSTPIAGLTRETLDKVFRPKGDGAGNLIELTTDELEFLVLFSSTTALTGVRGMAAYASANTYLDSFAHQARRMGVPAVSVNWGTWELMRGTSEQDRQNYLRAGLQPMSSAQALSALGDILASGATQAMAASIDWTTFKAVYQSRRNRPVFSAVSSTPVSIERTPGAEQPKDLLAMLIDTPPSDRLRTTAAMVLQEAAAVLALKPEEVDSDLGLFELGMDSLMSVELKRRLAARCGKPLPSTLTFNYPSVNALAAYLISLVAPALPPEPAPPLDKDQRDELSEDELAGLLEQALNIRS
jgi:NAD(P)-dependent dehydrogenase (short-subunit alcohol dehydrogenase family)/acyl carrier protein